MEMKQKGSVRQFPRLRAFVACSGGCLETGGRGSSCPSQTGHTCRYGCNGCKSCIQACPSGAISLGEQGVAKVNEGLCTACGSCVGACPGKLIRLHEHGAYIIVSCSNRDNGKAARDVCTSSCIGCGLCEKICTAGAITVTDHCAVIDESVCLSCGMCVMKCPRHAITDLRGIVTAI